MGEEFYAAIKLISGEEIFSLIMVDENNGDPVLILQNPVTMRTYKNNGNIYLKIKPWLEIPDDDFFFIKLDKVITITEIKNQSTIDFYLRYLNKEDYDDDDIDGKIKPSNILGYIGSVEDSRRYLEDLFLKDTKDTKDL